MVAPPPHDDAVLSLVFPVAAGLQAGLTASQLRGPRFDAPHHGLRLTAGGQPSLADVARALQRTNPGTAATHATAARLWGMWLPRQWERGPIHLARTRAEGGAPRRSGVVGHELHPQDPVLVRSGVRITTPAATWAALAQLGLPLADVVAAGDRVVTGLSASPSAKCWTAGTEPAAIRAAAPRATAVRVNFTVNRSLSFKKQTRCFATFCQTATYDMQRE